MAIADIAGINQSEYCFASSPYNSASFTGSNIPPTVVGGITPPPPPPIEPAKAWFEDNPNEISTEILKNAINASNFSNAQNHYVNKLFQYTWTS